MKVEMEIYPGEWVEVDPHDLYDDHLVSLASRMEEDSFDPALLNESEWWVWDLTRPRRPIRIVEESP